MATDCAPEFDLSEIQAVAALVGQEVGVAVAAALAAFGKLFLAWNARINLGGAHTPGELLVRHFKDAFAASRFVSDGQRVVDVGAGGGLPVIPLALVRRGARYDLFEPVGKKVAFLRTAVRELGLSDSVRIHALRLESPLAGAMRNGFDVAASRATLPPVDWLPLGRQLIRPGGRVLVFGTSTTPAGCPPASEEFRYDSDRCLFVYE